MSDPEWYKDAVIYELHVRSFYDANDNGFGNFEGLRQKLPYLESLGVNTLWLLPFLESPLRDDGYDIADYRAILPVHGSMDEFKAFLQEAHERGMYVITELVLNHTSDQHPWFQEARDPESDKHDWYVWSETDKKYEDARIIFTDTEVSNWTWDQKAQKYYWHRFFSHQPDLNYDNPEVREAMKEVMFYWFDLGVDGLRLDAIPYLYEREGTSCENLPETIEYIKSLRSAVEDRYGPGKVLLAEANQWPEDTLPYFGDGDGVQMAFNFPVMPRLFMALRRENRRPLIEMLELTDDIPEGCQWAIFLRNHDELTLEMVTDEERDYMYNEYASDPRFRINVGIRRRLAPLLGGDRRRIELMNAILLSMKGSPILYYGDEIGMGDDPFLGDRNGVRTPMQWSSDKNGGFSRAPHHRLFMPPINRGGYSYEFVNVEDAERDSHSLLQFMRRLIALRNQQGEVFGRGDFELLPVENQQILAYRRSYEGEQVLVVANLSRFSQSVHIPVDESLQGMVPVELFGQSEFPAFDEEPYHLTLAPHGFYWFKLESAAERLEEAEHREQLQLGETGMGGQLPVLSVPEGIENILIRTLAARRGPEKLENLLPDYLAVQRWYGGQRTEIKKVELADAVRLSGGREPVYLAIIEVTRDVDEQIYVLPLTLSRGDEAEAVLHQSPNAAVAWMKTSDDQALIHDATVQPRFWMTLFRWGQRGGKGRSLKGLYTAEFDAALERYRPESVRLLTGEQSNSAALLDDQYFIKLYRRLERGVNPEIEMLDYLSKADFPFTPDTHGRVDFKRAERSYALVVLQEALPVETDGWSYALDMSRRFFERVRGSAPPKEDHGSPFDPREVPVQIEEVATELLSLARTLGVRTAEMHKTLARAEAPDLHPQMTTPEGHDRFFDRLEEEIEETRRRLHRQQPEKDLDETAWKSLSHLLEQVRSAEPLDLHIRIHGDYHLGQVLRGEGEFYILDFEGEPARPLEERRERDSAFRDVAGMIRSFDYAIRAAYKGYVEQHEEISEENAERLREWAESAAQWIPRVFLDAYLDTTGEADFVCPQEVLDAALWAQLISKACYEIRYELDHRPDWVALPVRGLRNLLDYTPSFTS